VGSDDDGYAVRLKFSHIHHYVNDPEHMRDDSPLYIFDGSFGDKEGSKPLLRDYAVPEYFREDLFGIVGEKRRPPYRWVVIGPPRSGSSVHVDPLATSAWNALISGRKRWCLFPPSPTLKKPHLKPKGIGLDGESVTWFKKMYPRTRSSDWPHHRPLDAVQNPGEIMYVPDGWWHAVLNLEHTVAVTQNVVGSARFAKVWRMTKRGRPKMSAQWLAKLRERRPDLAAVADAQPRRGEESAGEETSSSSSSSSSEESSDTEDEYAFEGFGTLPARKKGDREAGDARNRTQTSDETLREMASEREGRKSASENGGGKRAKSPKSPKSPKKKSKKGDDVEMAG
jgi:histone arginine demethylase JMJD6